MPIASEISATLSSFDITSENILSVREVGRLLGSGMDAAVDELHGWLVEHQAFHDYFGASQRRVDRVIDAQRLHWHGWAQVQLDEAYMASRRHVGALYEHLQLPLEIHCALMSRWQQLLTMRLLALQPAPTHVNALIASLAKLIQLDMFLSLDEMARIQQKNRHTNELSKTELNVAVSLIWAGVLWLRWADAVDASRAPEFMVKILTQVSEHRVRVLVMDVHGMKTVDPDVANQWTRIAKATRLMGCESILAGISPAMAQTLVESDMNVNAVRTTATLRDAFETALGMVGHPHPCLGGS